MRYALALLVLLTACAADAPQSAPDASTREAPRAARAAARAARAADACSEALDQQALMFCWEIDDAAKTLQPSDAAWKTRAASWMQGRVPLAARSCFLSHLLEDAATERDMHHRPLERHVAYIKALQ